MKHTLILPLCLFPWILHAQLSVNLPVALTHLSLECSSASVGATVENDPNIPVGTREHHQTLKMEIRNLGATKADVVAIVYFFIRDASRQDGSAIYLDGSKTNEVTIPPAESENCMVEMPYTTEDVDNIEMAGAGQRGGDKPAGWISGFMYAGQFYPVDASSRAMLEDYAQSDDFKQQQADFEKVMPKSLGERQKQEDPSDPKSIAARRFDNSN